MGRRLAALVAVLVGVVFGIVALQAPAQAAVDDCAYGTVCLWSDYTFTNKIVEQWNPAATCYNLDAADNDKAVTFRNRLSTRHVQFYKDANCTGQLLRRESDCSTGPFPGADLGGSNAWGTFWWGQTHSCGTNHVIDVRKASSIWFNTS